MRKAADIFYKIGRILTYVGIGIFAVLALAYTCGGAIIAFDYRAFGGLESHSVFFILIPAILGGQNIYAWTIATCAFITLSTVILVYGTSRKECSCRSNKV